MNNGSIYLIGAGPGDPGQLTVRAAAALERADVVLYDEAIPEAMLAMAPASCECVCARKDEIEALMLQKARGGNRVVCLTGDDGSQFRHGIIVNDELQWFDRSPLFGKRVLITRPAHQADAFARALYAHGVEPILASTIAIVPPDDIHASHRAIDDLAQYAWLVFTSQNGVDAFFDRLRALDTDARYIGKTKVAAIGSKTAERLREYGVRADLIPPAFISEEVGRALIEMTADRARILIYRAQEARDVLPEMLEDAGRIPTVVAAYKTVFDADPAFAQKVARADILTFTSASTVRGFVELLGGPDAALAAARGKVIACIGPITAEAAEAAGLQVDVVADVYTTDGLLDALETHLALFA